MGSNLHQAPPSMGFSRQEYWSGLPLPSPKICWRRDKLPTSVFLGFLCGSAGRESARKAGNLGSIPGLGRSPGEGIGHPLQYSFASLVSSAGKESACNAGEPSLIPGSGRSAGEGIGHPLQYSWASLVAQLVKNLPAVWETWV